MPIGQLGFEGITLSIIIATLAAIVYSLRVLVVLERRIARMDLNLERMVEKVIFEESKIEGALHLNKKKKLKGRKR
jgi:hypothetical protein